VHERSLEEHETKSEWDMKVFGVVTPKESPMRAPSTSTTRRPKGHTALGGERARRALGQYQRRKYGEEIYVRERSTRTRREARSTADNAARRPTGAGTALPSPKGSTFLPLGRGWPSLHRRVAAARQGLPLGSPPFPVTPLLTPGLSTAPLLLLHILFT
jgi:hypothetical protein